MQRASLDEKEILKHLNAHSLTVQKAFMARVYSCAPSAEAIQALAERAPDRWQQLATMSGQAAGFNPKLEIQGTMVHRIDDLSDSQLEAALHALDVEFSQLDMQSNGHSEDEPGKTPIPARLIK